MNLLDISRQAIVLLNSIGTDMHLWDGTLTSLTKRLRVLRMDMRGHGASSATGGDYTLDLLTDDLAAVLDAASIERAALAGVSLGGMIAMQFALRFPDQTRAVIAICTSATMDRKAWHERVETVRCGGTAAIAETAMERFFSPHFRRNCPRTVKQIRLGLLAMDSQGYAGGAAAIRDMQLAEGLGQITKRTLVVTGLRDVSTPYDGHGDHLLAAIPNAHHLALPIEAPLSWPGQSSISKRVTDFDVGIHL